jgi:uncharacterized protein YukJ
MALPYGFVRAQLASSPVMKASRRSHETQYHLHIGLLVDGAPWDVAINVGTNDSDDLLKYKLVFDFRHPIIETLGGASMGATRLTGTDQLPALDYVRSDLLANTGDWRDSDVMDGSEAPEPVASLKRLLQNALDNSDDVYVFGRFYDTGDGIHDTHMNQGSTGSFVHRPDDDHNDHNDVWQDGAVFVNLGQPEWAAYFSAFNQQLVPTDDLGNPVDGAKTI